MVISSVGLLTDKSVSAQTATPISSIPAPTVPQFTVKFNSNFINVITTDPYTGANTTTTQNQSTIELSIANQLYSYSNGSTFSIYYNVRVKGHFANSSWTELYPTIQLLPHTGDYNINNFQQYEVPYIWGENTGNHPILPQSNTTYTTVSIPANSYPVGGQVDIQVEAMLGVNSTYFLSTNTFFAMGDNYLPAIAYVTSSDWSNTQTVTISETASSPTPTSFIPELSWSVIVPLLLSVLSVAVIVRLRKNR